MRRRHFATKPDQTKLHNVNEDIRHREIRVIGAEGDQLGVMSPRAAIEIAEEQGLDVVEISPTAKPPVCRLTDYDSFRYKEAKKKAAAKAGSKRPQEKTIRLRPKIDKHDMETKLRKASQCLSSGSRVKLLMLMRGREQAHIQLHIEKVIEMANQLKDVGEIISRPQREGRALTCILEPLTPNT